MTVKFIGICLLVSCLVGARNAVRCYQCESISNSACEDDFNHDMIQVVDCSNSRTFSLHHGEYESMSEVLSGDPDYRMKCVGFWKENLKSYLITYDDLDPLSKYRCWVYQRADLNRVLMSQAVGAFCNLKQDVTSWNFTEGAAVAIDMTEYERERDQCPMHFDDGSNPWLETENTVKVFDWNF